MKDNPSGVNEAKLDVRPADIHTYCIFFHSYNIYIDIKEADLF